MSEYEPGTVAVATVRGVAGVRVFRREDHHGIERWETAEVVLGWLGHADSDVTDIRPLVVLDPRDWANSADLSDAAEHLSNTGWNGSAGVLRAIVEQTKPPRIPEPGLWGVVEAHVIGNNGIRQAPYRWIHTEAGWAPIASTQSVREWHELVDPSLVREGVESDA